MKWISYFVTMGFVACVSLYARADAPVTFRQQHPLAWIHGLPTGEIPGWSQKWWTNFEVSHANVWNAPLTMDDTRNGRQYQYTADFEQTNALLEVGHALTDRFAFSVEVPYSYRSGGTLDGFIDGFHVWLGNRRYNRQYYPKNQNIYSVKTDGVEYYNSDDHLSTGVANLRLKLKFWMLKWNGKQKGSCPCGVAISSQTKIPVQNEKYGGTTGDIDQSFLLHLGVPLFTSSSMWFTAGYTKLGDNPAMSGWPRYEEITLYEGNFDFAFSAHWGILLSARAESPFLKSQYLEYFDTATDPAIVSRNRAASGWNSLVRWRGTQALGFRYRTSAGSQTQFLVAEDWGIGPYDASDKIYSNGASDVSFILQTQIQW